MLSFQDMIEIKRLFKLIHEVLTCYHEDKSKNTNLATLTKFSCMSAVQKHKTHKNHETSEKA